MVQFIEAFGSFELRAYAADKTIYVQFYISEKYLVSPPTRSVPLWHLVRYTQVVSRQWLHACLVDVNIVSPSITLPSGLKQNVYIRWPELWPSLEAVASFWILPAKVYTDSNFLQLFTMLNHFQIMLLSAWFLNMFCANGDVGWVA